MWRRGSTGKYAREQSHGTTLMDWRLALPLALAVAFGCTRAESDTLTVATSVDLADVGALSILVLASDGATLGAPGEIVMIDTAGTAVRRIELGSPASPRPIGDRTSRTTFRTPSTVVIAPASLAEPVVQRGDMAGELAIDPRGRYLLHSTGAGAIVIHDAATLAPISGWADVGAETSALAVSPEGDRLYQALLFGPGVEPELFVRDLQTGRVLRRVTLPHSATRLVTGVDGAIYSLANESDASVRLGRWSWVDGGLEQSWERTLDGFENAATISIGLSPDGRMLAVVEPQNEAGLRVIDAETGEITDRLRGPALDAAFDLQNRIYLLKPGELLRLQ